MVSDPAGFFVWRIGAEDEAERIPVSVGVREGGRVEIEAALVPGDRIVTAGTHKVRAGEKVTPVAAATAAPAVPTPPESTPGAFGARGGA